MKKLIFLILISISTFAQVKVTTLSGKANNLEYTNGIGINSTYQFPLGVAVSSNGIVYAFDDYINVIRKILLDGTTSQFCGNGTFTSPSFSSGFSDGGPTVAQFSNITCIGIDKQDNLFVIDNNRLRKITPQGFVTTITTNQTEFKSPEGLTIDSLGNIYVSDTGNKRIRKVATNGTITTIATGFTLPKGITLNGQNNLYVSDVTAIKKITQLGVVTNYAVGFNALNGICFDTQGNLYVADSSVSQIKKITVNGTVSVYAGNDYSDFKDGFAGFLRTSARLNNPQGLAIDINDVLYFADKWTNRIRKVTK